MLLNNARINVAELIRRDMAPNRIADFIRVTCKFYSNKTLKISWNLTTTWILNPAKLLN